MSNITTVDSFIGGAFTWFTGVVEDNLDPLQLGRVRVRCFGFHTDDKVQIPTESLPWALVMTPITNSGMSGVGTSATGIQCGSWVVGFFRDGPVAQDPLVLGTIPSISTGADRKKGFSDPSGKNPMRPGAADMPREARFDYADSSAYISRQNTRHTKIETAMPAKVSTVAQDAADTYYELQTWDVPAPKDYISPVYPNNQVTRTECGHVLEVDSSNSAERISVMHSSGTFQDLDSRGNKIETITRDSFKVIIGNDNVYIQGQCNLTIEGDLRTLVRGNYHLEVRGDMTENIHGSRQTKIGKAEQTEIGTECFKNVASNYSLRVGADSVITVDKNSTLQIGADSTITVAGDSSDNCLKDRTIYSQDSLSVSSAGTAIFASSEDMKIETSSDLLTTTDGNSVITISGNSTDNITGNKTNSVMGNLSNTISGSASESFQSHTLSNQSLTISGTTLSVTGTAITVTGSTSLNCSSPSSSYT